MKQFFALVAVVSSLSASAWAGTQKIRCEQLGNENWLITLDIDRGDAVSVVFSNRKGTVVSLPKALHRTSWQYFQGFVNYRLEGHLAGDDFRVEKSILEGKSGDVIVTAAEIESPDVVYHCEL